MRTKKELTLPSHKQIQKFEQLAKERLWYLFYSTPELRAYPDRMILGLTRLTEKGAIARTMATHMQERNIHSVEMFAHLVYLDGESVEVLSWLRFPCAFRHASRVSDRVKEDQYLLALCDLEWDRLKNTYTPVETARP